MGNVTTVASVQDAVELAQAYKAEGRYDWFRGQVRDWMPLSSLRRLRDGNDKEAIEQASTRFALFRAWLQDNAALSYLVHDEHIDEFFAVAQHYGIPTNYIDFTTEPAVAGFFAADTQAPPTDWVSCIYSLNTGELRQCASFVQAIEASEGTVLETVEVNVTNLWRLQAQHGVFLFSNYNWE